jgi:hypothetical protein
MALIALTTANKVEVVESIMQHTAPAAEAIVAGAPVRLDTSNGKFTNSNGTTAAEARVYGIATKTVAANEPLTAIRRGKMDGFDFTSQAYDAAIYVADTDGRLGDAAGTVSTVAGRVISAWSQRLGTAADKILSIEF